MFVYKQIIKAETSLGHVRAVTRVATAVSRHRGVI